MKRTLRCLVTLVLAGSLGACGLFDSGIEWRGGPYALLWIDTPDNISINHDIGGGSWSGRIDSTVFAVGWDGRYTPRADPSEFVTGPLAASEFQKKSVAMHLPGFSRTLASLE